MRRTGLLIILCIHLAATPSFAQIGTEPKRPVANAKADVKVTAAAGIRELYQSLEGQLLWYCSDCEAKRTALLNYISHSDTLGLQPEVYLASSDKQHRKTPKADSAVLHLADEALSEIALRFSRDLYAGADQDRLTSFDEVSPRHADADIAFLVQSLIRASDANSLVDMLNSLQPATPHYRSLKRELQRLPATEGWKRRALLATMNYYRWIQHFALDRYIVVNIPTASLRFYKGPNIALQMKTVVGTTDNTTPRLASHISEISLYPYWNMPRSIMMDEWFELIKDSRTPLDYHELEIVDKAGNVIPYERVKWKSMTSRNFPYLLRQKTGCANPLGVVKFGMNSPFDVYLHDTPGKGAFAGKNRYYSHGCVRVEDAIGLAQAIIPGKVDAQFLKACFSDQEPRVLQVPEPVPAFIVYMAAEADDSGRVIYHKDVYKLWEQAVR